MPIGNGLKATDPFLLFSTLAPDRVNHKCGTTKAQELPLHRHVSTGFLRSVSLGDVRDFFDARF